MTACDFAPGQLQDLSKVELRMRSTEAWCASTRRRYVLMTTLLVLANVWLAPP